MEQKKIYDLVVIGNGIAAQVFLWNLFLERKSQNFSVAVVSDEKIAPSCTLRSSATISLNGISEDVSPLGDEMRKAYFLFLEFFNKYKPKGVVELNRHVIATNENDEKKLTRRYKQISKVESFLFKDIRTYQGVVYPSFLICNQDYLNWFKAHNVPKYNEYHFFVKDIEVSPEGYYNLVFHSDSENEKGISGKKILLATGAFSKIYHSFFKEIIGDEKEVKNEIKAGAYLEREIDLNCPSFYISIDSCNVLYRNLETNKILQLGSSSVLGTYESANLSELQHILKKCQEHLNVHLGELSDFKITTGLRHKAPKRMLECLESPVSPGVFHINGLYKNGFSMSFLAAEKMMKLII